MIRATRRSLTAVLCALIAAAPGAPAPPESPASGESFSEQVFVELRNVLVFVTDRNGRPVSGLERGDFELYEDGEPVTISHFSAAAEPTPAGSGDPRPPEPNPEPSPAGPSLLVIYFDDANVAPSGRQRVLAALEVFLAERATTWDRFLVVARDQNLRIVQPLTDRVDEAREALAALRETAPSGAHLAGEIGAAIREIQEAYAQAPLVLARLTPGPEEQGEEVPGDPCTEATGAMEEAARQYAEAAADRTRQAIDGLTLLVTSLGGLPGRSALLYVSDGLEQQPGIALAQYLSDVCLRDRRLGTELLALDLAPELRRLAGYASGAGVTVYTLEAAGARVLGDVGIEDQRLRPSEITVQTQKSNLQGSLFLLADETGGQALLDATDLDGALEQVARDGSAYYSLAYAPLHWGDGRYHTLDVRVKGGHRLRHRKGYWDKPFEQLLAERLQATLLLGVEDNPLAARFEAAEIGSEGKLAIVALRLTMDPARLTFDAQGRGALRLMILLREPGGQPGSVREQVIPIQRDQIAAGTPHVIQVRLTLPAGRHEMALALRDEVAASASHFRRTIAVDRRDVASARDGDG